MSNFKNIPRGATLIDEKELEKVIKGILKDLPEEGNTIEMSFSELSSGIYSMVVSALKDKRLFYQGLNNTLVLDILNKESSKYIFSEIPSVSRKFSMMEEYDNLIWDKVNDRYYDKNRMSFLQKALGINHGESMG